MAALVAVRHNPQPQAFCQRTVAAGTVRKLAPVATVRKLIIILAALVRNGLPWRAP